MRRRLLLALPASAAGGSRLVQLVLLLVLVATSVGQDRALLVSGFALLGSFAILTDSGAAPYLLRTAPQDLDRGLHLRASVFHLGLAAAGAASALLVSALAGGLHAGSIPWSVLIALAVSGVADSATRTTRAPLLVARRDAMYAVPELVLTAAKAPFLAASVALGTPLPLLGVAVVSSAVLIGTLLSVRRTLPTGAPLPRRLYLVILEYGVSGSLSSLYSQAPLVIGTAVLGIAAAEPLAVAYRLVQPLEFLPATVSAQLIPRLRSGVARVRDWFWVFLLGGVVIAGAMWALSHPLDLLLRGGLVPAVFLAVLAAVPLKFVNYLLVALVMARGFILRRLVVTATVAVATVAATLMIAMTARSASAMATVSVGAEMLLLALLGGFLLARAHAATRVAVVA